MPETICACCPLNSVSLSTTISATTVETPILSAFFTSVPGFDRITAFHLCISSAHCGKALSFICLPHQLVNDSANYSCWVARRWFIDNEHPLPLNSVGVDFTVIGVLGDDYVTYSRVSKAIRSITGYGILDIALRSAKANFTEPSCVVVRNQNRMVSENMPRKPVYRQRYPRVRSAACRYPQKDRGRITKTTHSSSTTAPLSLPATPPSESSSASASSLATNPQLTPPPPSGLLATYHPSTPSPVTEIPDTMPPMPPPPETPPSALVSTTLVLTNLSTRIPRPLNPGKRCRIETPGQNRKRVRTFSPERNDRASHPVVDLLCSITPRRIPIRTPPIRVDIASDSHGTSSKMDLSGNPPFPIPFLV